MDEEAIMEYLDRMSQQFDNCREVLNDRTISDGTKLGMIMWNMRDVSSCVEILKMVFKKNE